MNPDPIAALRAVLAENARIPALEAEIAHLRKHNAQAVAPAADPAIDAMLRIPFSTIPEGWHKLTPAEHLPCPFCGGKATVHSAIDASVAPKVERWNATPSCGECGATGPSAIGTTHTEGIANAWAAWDRRS